MSRDDRARRIRDELWPRDAGPKGLGIYAVLDAARGERIRPLVLSSGLAHACLYTGASEALMAAAPHLVKLEPDARLTDVLLDEAWGDAWGIYLGATATLEELRRHLKQLLVVKDERGKKLAFRFYDPRVLRVYLPTCTAGELRAVFGPVSLFWMESHDGGEIVRHHREGEGLGRRVVRLVSEPWRAEC